MLSKTADELLYTEIPDNVYQGLKANPVKEVHLFARRGPAQAKFTPLELRELDHSPNVEVIVNPEDIEYDEGSTTAMNSDNQLRLVVRELERYAMRTAEHGLGDRPRKLFLHFFESPVEVLGDGKVEAFRTERTELDGTGNVRGTGVVKDWPVQAVYRCVGYRSTELADLPWDPKNHVVPHAAGRVLDINGKPIQGVYVNGWVKRGPVGLIGHTKSDAMETIKHVINDQANWWTPKHPEPGAVLELLDDRGVEYTNLDGWHALDQHELALGDAVGRTRIKVVPRDEMVRISRGTVAATKGTDA
jgi:ferredoxin--NADP+ reductase